MSKNYDKFKAETIKADDFIKKAEDMIVVSSEFARGFHNAMYAAREIYMRLEDEIENDSKIEEELGVKDV